jgi:LysR family transcriptional regulator, glycine cleavage system transcriptional activator
MDELGSSICMADLPPLATLRAFEAAARRGSFRDAASELGVTPSAVSHQVKLLEQWIGAPLFVRATRAVRLTPLGASLAADMSQSFTLMRTALVNARQADDPRLKISALPLFTNVWLVPNLERFQAKWPDAVIEIETTNRLADFASDTVDVAIRNLTTPPKTALGARKLMDLFATPLCAPALAARFCAPQDLKRATLIHISARDSGWPNWLKAMDLEGLKPAGNLSFDTVPSAIEAAVQGRGVILGLAPLIWDTPAARDLVVPFATPQYHAGSYYVHYRTADLARPLVRAFVEWLVAGVRADARRMTKLGAARLPA